MNQRRTYAYLPRFSTVCRGDDRRGKPFVGRERPLEGGRFDDEEKWARILAHVGDVAPDAPFVDSEHERASADVAMNRHAKDPGTGRRLVARLPAQAERTRFADERFGLHRSAARPGAQASAD